MIGLIELLADKKHVIWDWNGTLLNDVDHSVSTMNSLLTARARPPIERQYYRQIFEFPVINYYRTLGFDFDKESFESISSEFVALYMGGFRACPLIDGAEEVLRMIHESGVSQSILSAADQTSLEEMVSHFNLKQYFSAILGAEDKLASSKVQKGIDLIFSSPHSKVETVLIGDTEHDLEVGRHLGIDVILVGHGHQCPEKLARMHGTILGRKNEVHNVL